MITRLGHGVADCVIFLNLSWCNEIILYTSHILHLETRTADFYDTQKARKRGLHSNALLAIVTLHDATLMIQRARGAQPWLKPMEPQRLCPLSP